MDAEIDLCTMHASSLFTQFDRMKMKRSASTTLPSIPPVSHLSEQYEFDGDHVLDIKPQIGESPSPPKTVRTPTSSPKKARIRSMTTSESANTTVVPTAGGGGWESGWSPDKKEAIVARLMSLGIKSVNMSDLCQEFNLSKAQLGNALQTGHKNNLRDKAAKGVRS